MLLNRRHVMSIKVSRRIKKKKTTHSRTYLHKALSPPRILQLVDGMVRIFLGGTQTQNSMVLIRCSLSTLAAAVHHLKRKRERESRKERIQVTKSDGYEKIS